MTEKRPRTSPKDFFIHLLNIITLYITAFGFGRLLFVMINYYYPDVLQGDYYSTSVFDSMRWAISSIIIAYPVNILCTRFLLKDYRKEPEKKNLRVKQWIEYFTVFGTAVIILVSLMTVVYRFLGGELTTRFVLKTITVVYIAGVILTYYLFAVREQWEKLQGTVVKVILALATVSILASIVGGYLSVGSPSLARSRQFDEVRVGHLSYIQGEVLNYWIKTRRLPQSMSELSMATQTTYPSDPQTLQPYEYFTNGDLSFSLCATFNEDKIVERQELSRAYPEVYGNNIYQQQYKAGYNCFPYTINPELYPQNLKQ